MKRFFSTYTLKRLKEVNTTTKIPQIKKSNSNFCLVTDLLAVPGALPAAVTRALLTAAKAPGSAELGPAQHHPAGAESRFCLFPPKQPNAGQPFFPP